MVNKGIQAGRFAIIKNLFPIAVKFFFTQYHFPAVDEPNHPHLQPKVFHEELLLLLELGKKSFCLHYLFPQ